MKVDILKTTVETVNLPMNTVREVVQGYLNTLLPKYQWVRDGKVMQDEEHRHGSISEFVVRDATELDIAVYALRKHVDSEIRLND